MEIPSSHAKYELCVAISVNICCPASSKMSIGKLGYQIQSRVEWVVGMTTPLPRLRVLHSSGLAATLYQYHNNYDVLSPSLMCHVLT